MRISFSDKLSDKIYMKYIRVAESLSNFYYKHNKKIYTCYICGLKEAPFLFDKHNSLTNEFGWEKTNNKHWICHHCLCHDQDRTQEEWSEYVKMSNNRLKNKLKEKTDEN